MLTVKELIKKLESFDPNAIIVGSSSNFEKNGDTVDSIGIYEAVCVVKDRNYRDAFDGGSYNGKVYVPATGEKNGLIKCVNIYF